jgi:hypothetical protein
MDGPREWSDFPASPESDHLFVRFDAKNNAVEHTLRLRQQDVKREWEVRLGQTRLGMLRQDENDMVVYFAIPPGALVDGENELRIEQVGERPAPDDVRVGEVGLMPQPLAEVLSASTVEIEVIDADTKAHLPARITVIDENGSLQTVDADSNNYLVVRPGTIYTSTGRARFGLPPGKYTVNAGRGFEYSLAATSVVVPAVEEDSSRQAGSLSHVLSIRREVPTGGYVACDTHVHTLTHSGHGDATDRERVITVAAEGIELPIFTDHNVAIDYEPVARTLGVRPYFTPVIGNEVTTSVGHFNIFPIRPGSRQPDASLTDWSGIFDEIYATPGVKVAILNHARDLHRGTRPFGPKLHLDVVGENTLGWQLRAGGMEVVNSAATQTDVLLLFHDWMGLLNAGLAVTPVGSSDSHDVARHFVGQGRTYIRCDDADPAQIAVEAAVSSFLDGHVMVGYGLLAELTVGDHHTSGDLAPASGDDLPVKVRVLGPSWTSVDRVLLYSNGTLLREVEVSDRSAGSLEQGVKFAAEWSLPRPGHDVHLVAIAMGPGIEKPYWKTAKPYQPMSSDPRTHVIGCSGAVWVDADGDGQKTSPRQYAARLVAEAEGDLSRLVDLLATSDEAVASQAAHLYRAGGGDLHGADAQSAFERAAPATQVGIRRYLEAWRRSEIAAVQP